MNRNVINDMVASDIKNHMAHHQAIYDMAEVFKSLNDPTRLKIINVLLLSELCVNDIVSLLEMSQPAISHHLKELRKLKLVKIRKAGRSVFYSIR